MPTSRIHIYLFACGPQYERLQVTGNRHRDDLSTVREGVSGDHTTQQVRSETNQGQEASVPGAVLRESTTAWRDSEPTAAPGITARAGGLGEHEGEAMCFTHHVGNKLINKTDSK